MKTYKIYISMRAYWEDIIEIEDDQSVEDYLRSSKYELPEEPEEWDEFKIHWADLCDEHGKSEFDYMNEEFEKERKKNESSR